MPKKYRVCGSQGAKISNLIYRRICLKKPFSREEKARSNTGFGNHVHRRGAVFFPIIVGFFSARGLIK